MSLTLNLMENLALSHFCESRAHGAAVLQRLVIAAGPAERELILCGDHTIYEAANHAISLLNFSIR